MQGSTNSAVAGRNSLKLPTLLHSTLLVLAQEVGSAAGWNPVPLARGWLARVCCFCFAGQGHIAATHSKLLFASPLCCRAQTACINCMTHATSQLANQNLWCWQAFDGGKHLVHSGISASALYLFERLYSLAKVCTCFALTTLHSPLCTHHSALCNHHPALTILHSLLCTHHSALITPHAPLCTYQSCFPWGLCSPQDSLSPIGLCNRELRLPA